MKTNNELNAYLRDIVFQLEHEGAMGPFHAVELVMGRDAAMRLAKMGEMTYPGAEISELSAILRIRPRLPVTDDAQVPEDDEHDDLRADDGPVQIQARGIDHNDRNDEEHMVRIRNGAASPNSDSYPNDRRRQSQVQHPTYDTAVTRKGLIIADNYAVGKGKGKAAVSSTPSPPPRRDLRNHRLTIDTMDRYPVLAVNQAGPSGTRHDSLSPPRDGIFRRNTDSDVPDQDMQTSSDLVTPRKRRRPLSPIRSTGQSDDHDTDDYTPLPKRHHHVTRKYGRQGRRRAVPSPTFSQFSPESVHAEDMW